MFRQGKRQRAAKSPRRRKAAVHYFSKLVLRCKIKNCMKLLETLRKPEVKAKLLSGVLPPELKPLSLGATHMQLLVDLTPDETFLRMGIWLPQRDFLRKKTNWPFYYAYWKLGPYFLPVHAVLRFSGEYMVDRVRRAPQIRAGKILRRKFGADAEIRITESQYTAFVNGLEMLLERTKAELGQ